MPAPIAASTSSATCCSSSAQLQGTKRSAKALGSEALGSSWRHRLENHSTELYRILILSADACATFQTFQSSTDVQYRTVAVSGALALTFSLLLRLPSLQFDSLL